MKNIVKIIIFVVAIITCILAVMFAAKFDQEKMANYNEARVVNDNNPEMVAAFEATTPENLPAFVEQYRTEGAQLSETLKAHQVQKDILYTYIVELNELTEETFPEYQAAFPEHSKALFAKADDAQKYVDGFAGVASFENLEAYVSTLENEYGVIKQDFIKEKTYNKAYNSLVNQADAVNQVVSDNKKAEDLAMLQSDVKNYISNGKLLNVTVMLGYFLFAVCIVMLLFFALKAILSNIKSSYKSLLVIVAFVILVFIGYLIASPELTPSAIKMQHTVQQVKWIGAGMFVFYIALAGAICAVIFTAISNAIKNRK
ncbi:MAG: hypothetical protein MJZ52_06470 [Bacteroidales bacterium]|nr:hypothetical protein [Bacteroidales bacterium]